MKSEVKNDSVGVGAKPVRRADKGTGKNVGGWTRDGGVKERAVRKGPQSGTCISALKPRPGDRQRSR